MAIALETALRIVASLVNSGEKKFFMSDAELSTFLNTGYRRVGDELAQRGITTVEDQVDISTGPSDSQIQYDIGSDVVEPIELMERADASTEKFTLMTYRHPIPVNLDAGPTFRYWDWMDEVLWFPPVLNPRTVRVRYMKRFFPFTMPRGGSVGVSVEGENYFVVDNIVDPVCYYAASDAVASQERFSLAAYYRQQAEDRLLAVANMDAHLRQQRPGRRQRPRSGLFNYFSRRRW